jgi:hypothetical protein
MCEANWKIRTNKEFDELVGHKYIATFVNSLGIRSPGHV